MDLFSAANNSVSLTEGWQLARTAANAVASPAELVAHNMQWHAAVVPGTVAQVMQPQVADLDEDDWWYRCDFAVTPSAQPVTYLCFDGLATLAEVWLNGTLILQSQNMFLPQQVDVTNTLQSTNELIVCFRSLAHALGHKRPRPRWKTNLISHQQLRWIRTTLLGRIPGWCPPVAPVGPWRGVTLRRQADIALLESRINPVLTDEGNVDARFQLAGGAGVSAAQLVIGEQEFALTVEQAGELTTLAGSGVIDNAHRWWPHTHGTPHVQACRLVVQVKEQKYTWDLGARGFKQQQLLRTDGQVAVQVNGDLIFCRGACWTIADIYTLDGDYQSLRTALQLARDAGLNMLRIGGTMIYESDTFYQLCDELGIMVWQDFMFANMDYPVDDEDFHQQITSEARAQLTRLSRYACVSIYCGNSEVQQQSAMMGMGREYWSNSFFDKELPDLCETLHPGTIYFPSTPSGGALPFSVAEGLSHYYGVGAYKRAVNDAALSSVKFTPETLGFSHIPEPNTVDKIFNGALFAAHHPQWKARVPRDSAAGWDFEDIRDYYLGALFQEDPVALRSHNPQRYLELSRVVTGEVIQRVFAIWRSVEHPCQGALLWFYKDLWPGAGWGILDSDNQPKAVYYAVKRASKTLAVYCVDRGLDGLQLVLVNETDCARAVTVEGYAYRTGGAETASFSHELTMDARSTLSLHTDHLLGYFADLTYSYRFGPRQHDLVMVRLRDTRTGEWLHEDFYFPASCAMPPQKMDFVTLNLVTLDDGQPALKITTAHFLQSVRLELKSHLAEDNYFHLAPGSERLIRLQNKTETAQPVKGYLEALNLLEPIKVR